LKKSITILLSLLVLLTIGVPLAFADGYPQNTQTQLQSIGGGQVGIPTLFIAMADGPAQYAACPVGTGLNLEAYLPEGALADFYEITSTDSNTSTSIEEKQFLQGYNPVSFPADIVGRHILFFTLNNQPSNLVIIDVLNQAPVPTGSTAPSSGPYPGAYPGGSGLPSTVTPTQPQYSPALIGGNVPATTSGDTPVTIQSKNMRGYLVYLDGVYIGKETKGDGTFSFMVQGNMNHDIRVFDGVHNYPKSIFFERGVLKIIKVEPGVDVYL